MGKGKASKSKSKRAPKTLRKGNDTDDDDVYDEVDLFHKGDRDLGGTFDLGKKASRKEVLNVEGDYSEDEVERVDDGNVSSDWDDDSDNDAGDNIEAQLPSREQWGKSKSTFYSTSFVDKDFGGAGDDEEEEAAALEEEDATARQRALDAAVDVDVLNELDDDDEQPAIAQVVKDVDAAWNLSTVRKANKETSQILKDYTLKSEMFGVVIEPLVDVANALPDESPLKTKILLCANTYGAYLCTVQHWLSLKAKSFESKRENDPLIDEHPALGHIWKLKEMSDRVDAFVGRNSDLFSRLISKAKEGGDVDVEVHKPVVTKKKAAKLAAQAVAEPKPWEVTGEEALEGGEEDEDGRRGINYTIEKNKAQKYKKKKAAGTSKLKKREQFKKAMQKHRSQRPQVRQESEKYGGEARGIRASTVKSIKLKA